MNTYRTGRTIATMLLAAAPVGVLEFLTSTSADAAALRPGSWTAAVAAVAAGFGLWASVSAGRRRCVYAPRHGRRG